MMMYKFLVGLVVLFTLSACGDAAQEPDSGAAVAAAEQSTVNAAPKPPVASQSVATPAAGKYVAGKHYRVLPRALPTNNPNKVEVAEFFWYGCSHCYTFEPLAQTYKQGLPETIEFIPIPAMWNDVMQVHAKAFYAAKAFNKPEIHAAIFEVMNVERKRLASDSAVADLFAEHGIDKSEALKMLNSFGVSAQVNKARSLAAGAKLSGTPTLMVNGKYVVESSLAGSQQEMLKVADYLAKLEVAQK